MLGYDTLYYREVDAYTLISRAIREDRQILTRKSHLMERKNSKPHTFFIKDNDPSKQIIEVLAHYKLTINPRLCGTRCLRCNEKLKEIAVDQAVSRVPEYVINTQNNFSTCPHCKRIYWKGTHYANMRKTVNRLKNELSYLHNNIE